MFLELVETVFVAPNTIVHQIRDASLLLEINFDFAVRQCAALIMTVERCMVKIADTFVPTTK